VRWNVVAAYAALMLPAAWVAALIFDLLNPSALKLLVGVFILASVVPWKLRPEGEPELKTFALIGALSGFLGVFVGAVGPAVVPFFNRLKLPRDGILSTKSAGQMALQFSKILAFGGAAGVDFLELKGHIGLLILATLVGVGLSIPLGRKLSDERFNKAVNLLLVLIALKVIVEGIRELASA
jgi:uncharacterized membrane protein YfcA